MKYIFSILAITLLFSFLVPSQVQAAVSDTLVSLDAIPAITYYPNETNRLVMQIDVTPTGQDSLTDISIVNSSLAPVNFVTDYKLWQDNGDNSYDGGFNETLLGSGNNFISNSSIFWTGLNVALTGTTRFYITIDTNSHNVITTSSSLEFKLVSQDINNDGKFDFQNDLGVFMSSGEIGPANGVTEVVNNISIANASIDVSLPIGVIDSPLNGATLYGDSFTITGQTRDQGAGNVSTAYIIINGQQKQVDTTNGFANWSYSWGNVLPGSQQIILVVEDTNNNTNSAAYVINVTVDNVQFSAENSTTSIDKTTAKADNDDSAVIFVFLKDINKNPVIGRPITVQWDNGISPDTVNVDSASDSVGGINIVLKSLTEVNTTASIYYEGQLIGSESVIFTRDISTAPPVAGVDAQSGDLIKASKASVYYLGADGKRYVFPNEDVFLSWYPSFDAVVTLSDAELGSIPIGGNVTFRPGTTLVKITTDPKVYAVDASGTLRWIENETVAVGLYGADWATKIIDIPDPFFVNYTVGASIADVVSFDVVSVRDSATNINADKGL